MSDFGQKYVVDTNALSQIGRRRRASALFQEKAVIPSEVLHEAEGFPDVEMLRRNLYPSTSGVLEWLVRVMATVPAEDTALVDLYANRGAADPLVVASALNGQDRDSLYLDAPEWVVVTNDDAVRNKAVEFGLEVLSSVEFAAVIDASESREIDEKSDTACGVKGTGPNRWE